MPVPRRRLDRVDRLYDHARAPARGDGPCTPQGHDRTLQQQGPVEDTCPRHETAAQQPNFKIEVEISADRRGSVKVRAHSLNAALDAIAMDAFSSRSVNTWKSSSAPRRSSLR